MTSLRDEKLIGLTCAGLLAALLLPLPLILAHTSPNATIGERYTAAYAALLALYVGATVGWAVVTAWAWMRLTPERVSRWQEWLTGHPRLALAILLAAVSSLLVLAYLLQVRAIGLPENLLQFMRYLPYGLAAGLTIIGGVLAGEPINQLARRFRNRRGWKTLRQRRYGLALGVLIGLLVLSMFVQHALFQHPLAKDATVHLYIGQRLLAGDIPYRDVLYFHPPGRFVVSGIWAGIAQLFRLPPVESARLLNLSVGGALVAATYGVGQKTTGRRFGGLVAVLLLLLMSTLVEMLGKEGPNLKVEISLALVASVWAAQQRRWFWAGILVAAGIMLWLPVGISAAGLALTAGLNDRRFDWRAVARLTTGSIIVLGLSILALAAVGALQVGVQQTVLSALGLGSDRAGGWHPWHQDWSTVAFAVGGWLVMALAAVGAIRLAVKKPGALHDPTRSVILLGMLPLAVIMSAVDRLYPGDMIVLLPMAATLGVLSLEGIIAPAAKWLRLPSRWGEGLLIGMLLVQVTVTLFSGWKLPPPQNTLADQQSAAMDLDRQVGSGSVQAFNNLWFVVLTHRRNVLPVVQTGAKAMESNERAGWGESAIRQGLIEARPTLIILSDRLEGDLVDYLSDDYMKLDISQPGEIWLRTGP